MKLALVFDAPRAAGMHAGVAGAYLDRVLAACQEATNESQIDMKAFYAIDHPQPGGKAPLISEVRSERDRLIAELEDWQPDRILSVGAGALNALALDSKRVLTISKERGRMRMLGDVPWLPTISHAAVIRASDLHRDFANDVYKVMSQAAPLPPMAIELRVPDSSGELEIDLGYLEGASVVGVDVETTGLEPQNDDLLAVGIGAVYDDTHGIAVIIRRDLIAQVEPELWDAIWRSSRRSVGHNFKFDSQFLAPLIGWPPPGALLGDTLLLAHLLDERPNRPKSRVRGLSLKDLVAVRYDHEYGFDFQEFYEAEEPDFDALHSYLGEDVVYTARLWHDLKAEADEESPRLLRAHDDLLMPVSRAIARCEWSGAPVDIPWVRETIAAYDHRIGWRRSVLERSIVALAPTMVVDNIMSNQKVADVMYDEWGMTPDVRRHGKLIEDDRSTDKDHIRAAVSKYLGTELDRQARWLRSLESLRRDDRTRTTYQKSLLDKTDDDGRVRASFLIHGTSTGRLSSREPNLQNVPSVDREDSNLWRPMRRAFRPRDGRLWVEVDYSQLELRVAAALSADPILTAVFESGRDIHQEIASAIFSKEYDAISKAERFLAKAVGFGIIYGRGAKALASGAEMRYVEQKLGGTAWTEEQADAFIKKFLRTYPDLSRWMDETQASAPVAGFVESPFGRRRRFPLIPKSRGELGEIQRQAVNTPVQSAASDICLEAMVRIQDSLDALPGIDAQVLFPVHDSICLECRDDAIVLVESICRGQMERDFMGVPLTVDFEYGPTWADVHRDEERFNPALGQHE